MCIRDSYQISTNDEGSSSPIEYTNLPPEKYQLSNGYIPRPLNLDGIEIPECLNQLVDKLAENAHNVWAVGRIKQGWTYGKSNVSSAPSSPKRETLLYLLARMLL